MTPFRTPTIQKEIPFPPPDNDGRKRAAVRRQNPPSPWIAFLRSLEAGDSFEVDYFEYQNARPHAKRLGMITEARRMQAGPRVGDKYRIWVVRRADATPEEILQEFKHIGDGI